MLAACTVGVLTAGPAWAQDGGVSDRDLFGVEPASGNTPADPQPTALPDRAPPARRGLSGTGDNTNRTVRTGLSPNEVKRPPTEEELEAARLEAEQRNAQEWGQLIRSGGLVFIITVLLIVVLGGMAYAGYILIFTKDEEEEAPPEGEDAFAHLVSREPTPAPSPAAEYLMGSGATPAPVPARTPSSAVADQRKYLSETPTPRAPSHDPRAQVGHDLISRARAGHATPPSISPTATPAPMVAARPHPDPTPASYVAPVRPQTSRPHSVPIPGGVTPQPPPRSVSSAPAPKPVSSHPPAMTPGMVSFGNPIPLETPDGPAYLPSSPSSATPVPTFETVKDTSTPAPQSSAPYTPSGLTPMSWLDEEGEDPDDDDTPPTEIHGFLEEWAAEDDEVIIAGGSARPSNRLSSAGPRAPRLITPGDEDVEDAQDPWTQPLHDPSSTVIPRPRVRKRVATPPPMPWRKS